MSTRCIKFTVYALPASQGSKRALPAGGRPGGRPLIVENNPAKLRAWRTSVIEAARQALNGGERMEGAVWLEVTYVFARPKSHFGRRGLLPSAPQYHTQKPDRSKLDRSLEDALTEAAVWRDDAQVCSGYSRKTWGEFNGAYVRLIEAV